MKLTCEAVEDLYVLYMENELHPSVKKAVDEHLEQCKKCQKLYETGANFSKETLKQEEKVIKPSPKLDNQIRLKLKLRRLRMLFLFFIAVVLIFSFFRYVDNRNNILYEVSTMERPVWDVSFELENVKMDGDMNYRVLSYIEKINQGNERINRLLNFYEERKKENHPYRLSLNSTLIHFEELLHKRYQYGHWNERDEKALTQMVGYFEEIGILLTDERLKLNDARDYHFDALFKPFPVAELEELYLKIDRLAYTYSNFQKFPDEMDILSEEDIKNRARDLTNEPEGEVVSSSWLNKEHYQTSGAYSLTLKGENQNFNMTIDAYSGNLKEFSFHGYATEGDLLNEVQVQKQVEDILPRLLDTSEFKVIDLGLNYQYNSNIDNQLYTYEVIPMHSEFPTNSKYRIYVDARTGKITSFSSIENHFYSNLTFGESDIVFDMDEGRKEMKKKYSDHKFSYIQTMYIPSLFSNQYELVHEYVGTNPDGFTTTYYLNVQTGEEEKAY